MVKFKIEIPDVPRIEIDRLENILDNLLYKGNDKNKKRWECSGNDITENYQKTPFADLLVKYWLGEFNEAPLFEIDAKGTTKEGDFKVVIRVNMPDQNYNNIEEILSREAPYLGRLLEKKSKIKS